MRHAGGGARRGGDRPGGAEVMFSPTRRGIRSPSEGGASVRHRAELMCYGPI